MSIRYLSTLTISRKTRTVPTRQREAQMWRRLGENFETGATHQYICFQIETNEGEADYLNTYCHDVVHRFVNDSDESRCEFFPLGRRRRGQDGKKRVIDVNRAMFCYLMAELVEDGTMNRWFPDRWRELRGDCGFELKHEFFSDEPPHPTLWPREHYLEGSIDD